MPEREGLQIRRGEEVPISLGLELELFSKGGFLAVQKMYDELRTADPTSRMNGDEDPEALIEVKRTVADNKGRQILWKKRVGPDNNLFEVTLPVGAAVAIPDEVSGVRDGTVITWTNGHNTLLVPRRHDTGFLLGYQSLSDPGKWPLVLTSQEVSIQDLIPVALGKPAKVGASVLFHPMTQPALLTSRKISATAVVHPLTREDPEGVSKMKARALRRF